MTKKTIIAAAMCFGIGAVGAAECAFRDTSLSFEERAADLVSRLTLEEKFNQLGRNTAAVPRLGLAKYDYWNEALHGIQNGTGEGTSFPMPLSLAVTWDEKFIARVASAIADECRGHNQPISEGGRGRGLTYWCPTINLGRHPLWGRTNEAYGEDAFVAGMLSSAFVEGMKGEGKFLKTVPTIKHYALNNHEKLRGSTSSDASDADIRDYYARVYRYVIERTDVPSLMAAYNAVNYTPSSANPFLLDTLLRRTFGFTGFVVSDCGAIDNIERQQKWQPAKNSVEKNNYAIRDGKKLSDYVDENGVVTKPGSVAMALMAGCDMDCNGDIYPAQAKKAHAAGLISESRIDINVYNNLLARFKLGEFDPASSVPYRGAGYDFANVVETPEHRALAEESAARGVVLLKNEKGILPLDAAKLKSIAIVGDMADTCFLGNYCGKPKERTRISVYSGICDYLFKHKCKAKVSLVSKFAEGGAISPEDAEKIRSADVVFIMGADMHEDSSEGHDRETLSLSRNQNEIIAAAAKLNPNSVLFLQTSNMVELGAFKDLVKAIFWSSQNGQAQGVGVARQLFGETNPSGRLTFTWYAREADIPGIRQYGLDKKFLPEEQDYPHGGFTYQYFTGEVDYPFGYGLSYTSFEYSGAKIDKTEVDANGELNVSVDVKNTGKRAGSEVVQVYVVYPKAKGLPSKQIKGYAKVDLAPGETKSASVRLDVSDFRFWNGSENVVPNGEYAIEIAASAADVKATKKVVVKGKLAESVNVVAVQPEDVVAIVGKTVKAGVSVCLKNDRILAPGEAKLSFASSRPAVASVDAAGVVTGKAPGTALITVTASYKGSSKKASFPIAVVSAPADGSEKLEAPADPKEGVVFPSVKLGSAAAKSIKLNAKLASGAPAAFRYAIVEDGVRTAKATLKGDILSIAGPGRVTVSAAAVADGQAKEATAQFEVSDAVNRDELEEAIRVKVSGDDYDPATLAAYEREIVAARAVFFDPKADQAAIDAARDSLEKVKSQLRDYRHVVADFKGANRSWPFNSGRTIWVQWSNAKDAEGRDVSANLVTHDPKKLELRFRLTLSATDYRMPFLEAVAGGSFIKLRSTDVAQKDNDPDLQVFGGRMATNNEHNYGWLVQDWVKDWGVTEVRIPLAKLNPDGKVGLPFIDKGFVADGKSNYSRGKIDWSHIDRFFMQINFVDEFKKTASATAKIENCRIVDVTLEEERELLAAALDEKLVGGCDCPGKREVYAKVEAAARAALGEENVGRLRKAVAALGEARVSIGVSAQADKSRLGKLLASERKDLSRYTKESAAQYAARFAAAGKVFGDPAAKQLAVNRAAASLEGADEMLRLIKTAPYELATLFDGERSVEEHALKFVCPADLDLSAHADYDVTVRYEVKLESVHPNPPKDDKWLKLVVNGKARVNDKIDIASMNCERDSSMTGYSKSGEWFALSHDIPVKKLEGGKLTRFETYMFNDTGRYAPEPSDGNRWNNDTGVKMTVRSVKIFSDMPR